LANTAKTIAKKKEKKKEAIVKKQQDIHTFSECGKAFIANKFFNELSARDSGIKRLVLQARLDDVARRTNNQRSNASHLAKQTNNQTTNQTNRKANQPINNVQNEK
jgi:hypothetical protein